MSWMGKRWMQVKTRKENQRMNRIREVGAKKERNGVIYLIVQYKL